MVARGYDQPAPAHPTAADLECVATDQSLSKTPDGTEPPEPGCPGSWPLCLSGTASSRSKGIPHHLSSLPSAYLGSTALWSAWRDSRPGSPLQSRHCRDDPGCLSILYRQPFAQAALLTVLYGDHRSHDTDSGGGDG